MNETRIQVFLFIGFIGSLILLYIVTTGLSQPTNLTDIDQNFIGQQVQLRGLVQDVKTHEHGHLFFTLVDGEDTIHSVVWADQKELLELRGMKIIEGQYGTFRGVIELYRGELEFIVSAVNLEVS